MADYSFGGSEEENAELRKSEAELVRLRVVYVYIYAYSISNQTHIATGRGPR